MEPKLKVLDLFTPTQCEAIRDTVLELRHFLIDRGGFYTLGAATYQDPPLAYPAIANAFNMILQSAFVGMYEDLKAGLEKELGVPVGRFDTGAALPGFHVFDAQSGELMGHPHIDEPYTRVDFSKLEWSDPFSFTIPIEIPDGGAGIDFWWNFTDADIETFINSNELPEAEYTEYELGKLYLHDGLTPHRIANPEPIKSGQFRITLQGHGVMTPAGAVIYF